MIGQIIAQVRSRALADAAFLASVLAAPDDAELLIESCDGTGSYEEQSAAIRSVASGTALLEEWRMDAPPTGGWLPAGIYLDGDEARIEWIPVDLRIRPRPFYREAVDDARGSIAGKILRCSTPLAALAALASEPAPTALVFHVSRCGSTLVGRMLAAFDDTLVVSEPGPLDMAIRLWLLGTIPAAWVRGMAAALVRTAAGNVSHRVIKLDAWHALSLGAVAGVFPGARALFLFRNPLEVLVSHRRDAGSHTTPGALPLAVYGLRGAPPAGNGPYSAWVLGAIMRAGIAAAGRQGLLFCDYAALPAAVLDSIAPHFGITPDSTSRDRVREASRLYSKDSGRDHVPDTADKQSEADDSLRDFIGRYDLDNLFAGLAELAEERSPAWPARRPPSSPPPRLRFTKRHAPPSHFDWRW